MKRNRVPYLPVVVGACLIAVAGYAVFSWWAVFISGDATMTGDVIGTWKSFAVLAFGFWLGSSSAGKSEDNGPTETKIVNSPGNPVPVEEEKRP